MKARLSVPRREPTAGALADEGVSGLWLRYVIDVHHLDCPLLFGCQRKKKQSCERKERKVNKFVSSGPLLQIDFRYDILSFQSLAKVSTMTRTISNH
jgi:hypothetical protein